MNLTDPSVIKHVMSKFGKKFAKSLGQNFLTDDSVIEASVLASGLSKDETAFEIGPGIGVLTSALAEKAGNVVSIEIDTSLMELLDFTLADYNNITVINDDFMKLNLDETAEKYFGGKKARVVANLPYYITTPVLVRLFEYKKYFSSITILVQKEVAERMAALPGKKDFGMLSLLTQYHTKADIIKIVPPGAFMPPPKVSSAVIHLDMLEKPPVNPKDVDFMFKIIKASFAQRRKTLANGISNAGIGLSREDVTAALEKMDKNPLLRGETLSLAEFADLSDILLEKLDK